MEQKANEFASFASGMAFAMGNEECSFVNRYNNREIYQLSMLQVVAAQPSRSIELASGERDAWGVMAANTSPRDISDSGKHWPRNPCSRGSPGIPESACNDQGRLTALSMSVGQSSPAVFAATHKMPALSFLRIDIHATDLIQCRAGKIWHLPGGPATKVLKLAFGKRTSMSGVDVLKHLLIDDDDVARLSQLQELVLLRDDDASFSVPAHMLEPICKLTSLRFLVVVSLGLEGLPACLGQLRELKLLDVRSNSFLDKEAFPQEMMANLSAHLVEFVGFSQNERKYRGPESECTRLSGCTPMYETLLSGIPGIKSGEDEEEGAWRCGSFTADTGALLGPPGLVFPKLEKLWFDMCGGLTMRPDFLASLPTLTPRLRSHLTLFYSKFNGILTVFQRPRSLDLYDNRISLDVKHVAELKRLPGIHQVLLQNNRLHGRLEAAFFADWPKTWLKLNLALNRDLQGCLHPVDVPPGLMLMIGGTGIKVSEACGQGSVPLGGKGSEL